MQGSGHGKACAACVKAKQHCGGFLGEEKRPVAESTGLGEVTAILQDAVEVLKGIRSGMRSLEEAVEYHAFWRSKHKREYQAMVPGKDGKNVEEEMEVEKEKEKEGFVIGDHVHRSSTAFQVLMPVFEGLKDREKFLVVSVVVEFCGIKGAGMEGDGVNFAVRGVNGEDGGESIV
jgi:hypothetical protein